MFTKRSPKEITMISLFSVVSIEPRGFATIQLHLHVRQNNSYFFFVAVGFETYTSESATTE